MKEDKKNFLISSDESVEYGVFDLTSGYYNISYVSKLEIPVVSFPERITIGASKSKESNFEGCIDEFKISSDFYSDYRSSSIPTEYSKNITMEYLDPEPECPGSSINLLIPFDNPFKDQIRELKRKSFLDSETNFSYKLSGKEVERLSKYINDESSFVAEMIDLGFGIDMAKRVFYEVHKAEGGPIYNIARYYPKYNGDVRFSGSGPNSRFNGSGRFTEGYSISVKNANSNINKDRFTIEMWISTLRDTYLDDNKRVILDTRSVVSKIKKSKFNKFIEMDEPVGRVVSVKILSKKSSNVISRYYDEVSIDNITGRMSGAGGVGKDYSSNYSLINNSKTILLEDKLPKSDAFVEVIYIPKSLSESYISIYKTNYGTIKSEIFDGVSSYVIEKKIRWMKNTWHRLVLQYSAGQKHYSLLCDGEYSKYSSAVFPTLSGSFGIINIGSDYSGEFSANSKISNIRISDILRYNKSNLSGIIIDPAYNRNIEAVTPVLEDSDTKIMFDFSMSEGIDNNLAILQNPSTSIYKFDVNISDNYNILDEDSKYNLLSDLINRLKPSHSNVKVKSEKYRC
jgi:hypothetical protein